MITPIVDINELDKVIRKFLIEQSELNSNKVLNALSIRGTDLDELIAENTYDSISTAETTMLFETKTRNTTSDMSMTTDETTYSETTCANDTICGNDTLVGVTTVVEDGLVYYKAFRVRVILYGNDSINMALKLISRFRTDKIRNDFYDNGIYLETISDSESVNEYKNETMWLRTDFDIDISVKFETELMSRDEPYEIINKLEIIRRR